MGLIDAVCFTLKRLASFVSDFVAGSGAERHEIELFLLKIKKNGIKFDFFFFS